MAIKEGPALRVLKSERMRAFCREFICTGGRGELAAKRAGYAGANARRVSKHLLNDGRILAAIAELIKSLQVLLIGFALAVFTLAALRLFRLGTLSTEISGATFLMGFGLKHLPGTSSDSADRNPV